MKTLCDLKKDYIEENISEVIKLVDKPKYVCRKCLRSVNEKDMVCKPILISDALMKKK